MQIKFQTALITGSSRGLGRQIAVKLAMEGVKKIAIHYRTGRSDAESTLSLIEAAGTPQEWQDAMLQWVESGWSPMRRRATPGDVCALLCSDEARFVTGQAIAVDGGSFLMNSHFPLALQLPA